MSDGIIRLDEMKTLTEWTAHLQTVIGSLSDGHEIALLTLQLVKILTIDHVKGKVLLVQEKLSLVNKKLFAVQKKLSKVLTKFIQL